MITYGFKNYGFFIISSILFVSTVIVGLFHLEERDKIFYILLGFTGILFSIAFLEFLILSLKSLWEEYKKHGSFFKFMYEFFASVKLAIFIMITLGILSMLGSTYIQQNQPIGFYLDRFGADVGVWFWKLWLNDVFRSWYYIAFIVLLAINLIVCSIKRLPKVWITTFTKERFQKLDEHAQKHLKPLTLNISTSPEKVALFLKKLGFRVYMQEENDRVYFYGEKGKYSRLGVYIVHIGLLVIMAGALIDALFGIRGTVIVVEGSKSDILTIPSKDKSYQLPFQIALDKFHIVTYEDEAREKNRKVDPSIKDAIASFESEIRIIQDGTETAIGKTAVNSPFNFGFYRIFQATYGLTGEVGKATIAVFDKEKLSNIKDPQQAYVSEVKLINGKVTEFGDMLISIDRSTLNIEDENKGFQGDFKPAIMLKVIKDGQSYDVPVLYSPELTVMAYSQLESLKNFPYIFFLFEAEPQYFSGFQVAKNPGTWIIWAGSILLVIGMLLAFYTIHRKVWIRLEENTMKVAFWSHKLKEEFNKGFIRNLEELKNESSIWKQ